VCDTLVSKEATLAKGHYTIQKLDALIKATPDTIVMTGDAVAVQKALFEAIAKNPALAEVPAINNHAIYSLPVYVDPEVMDYPWFFAAGPTSWHGSARPPRRTGVDLFILPCYPLVPFYWIISHLQPSDL
jgi:hypothetical protein